MHSKIALTERVKINFPYSRPATASLIYFRDPDDSLLKSQTPPKVNQFASSVWSKSHKGALADSP